VEYEKIKHLAVSIYHVRQWEEYYNKLGNNYVLNKLTD